MSRVNQKYWWELENALAGIPKEIRPKNITLIPSTFSFLEWYSLTLNSVVTWEDMSVSAEIPPSQTIPTANKQHKDCGLWEEYSELF